MDPLLLGGLALVLVLFFQSRGSAPAGPNDGGTNSGPVATQPISGISEPIAVTDQGVPTLTQTGTVGGLLPPSGSYYGQANYVPTTLPEGTPTEIPDWLGITIVGAFGLAPELKAGNVLNNFNPTTPSLLQDMHETYPGSGVWVPNTTTSSPGPTDPALDPNYDYSTFDQAKQIAVETLAQNEAGTSTDCRPVAVYGWVVQPDGSQLWQVVGEETPEECYVAGL